MYYVRIRTFMDQYVPIRTTTFSSKQEPFPLLHLNVAETRTIDPYHDDVQQGQT